MFRKAGHAKRGTAEVAEVDGNRLEGAEQVV